MATLLPPPKRQRVYHGVPEPEKEPPKPGQLKRVTVPRETLPRFLAIAKINTSLNRETCGLLLGNDRGGKYVVTTLLIPKQHSTSDTCMMDEEELVLQFTEDRHLITLGWVSGLMFSDLETHSADVLTAREPCRYTRTPRSPVRTLLQIAIVCPQCR